MWFSRRRLCFEINAQLSYNLPAYCFYTITEGTAAEPSLARPCTTKLATLKKARSADTSITIHLSQCHFDYRTLPLLCLVPLVEPRTYAVHPDIARMQLRNGGMSSIIRVLTSILRGHPPCRNAATTPFASHPPKAPRRRRPRRAAALIHPERCPRRADASMGVGGTAPGARQTPGMWHGKGPLRPRTSNDVTNPAGPS